MGDDTCPIRETAACPDQYRGVRGGRPTADLPANLVSIQLLVPHAEVAVGNSSPLEEESRRSHQGRSTKAEIARMAAQMNDQPHPFTPKLDEFFLLAGGDPDFTNLPPLHRLFLAERRRRTSIRRRAKG